MRRFQFRLQVLLDQALRQEEEERLRLAKIQQEREAQLQTIATAQARHAEILQGITRLQQQSIDLLMLQACHLRREALGNDLQQYREALSAIDARIQQQQLTLGKSTQRRQTLENVRQQHYDLYRREAERQELKEMEEAVLPRLAREQAMEQARLREEF